jgi:hypothetical protein
MKFKGSIEIYLKAFVVTNLVDRGVAAMLYFYSSLAPNLKDSTFNAIWT